tara:strand:+ start:312 stop:701 length:390 start_codon:yes stop_codon:yes gene_type:complete
MKLINDYAERFHSNSLPAAEKCFLIEDGDEIFIKKWIDNGKINGKAKDMFEWIEKKYLNNKYDLKNTDQIKFDEIHKRFYIKYWRMIILLSDYQIKYRYYSRVINSIKEKSYPDMETDEFLKLFKKNKS